MSAASSPTRQFQTALPNRNVASTVAAAASAEGKRTPNSPTPPPTSATSAPSQWNSGGLTGCSTPLRSGRIQPPPFTISQTSSASLDSS